MNSNSTTAIDEDDEYPEITQADLDRAVFRQNLETIEKKQRITIMLDSHIVQYFKAKAGKRGYQTLINESLNALVANNLAVPSQDLEQLLRTVIREELKHR